LIIAIDGFPHDGQKYDVSDNTRLISL
jgi:hypothetical protein